jgi:hypothetical protein
MIVSDVTDKIGFFYFVLRVNNAFSSKDVVFLSKKLHHHIISNEEQDINKFSYLDLLNKAYTFIEKIKNNY